MMKQTRAGQLMMGDAGRLARKNTLTTLIDGRQLTAAHSTPRQQRQPTGCEARR
jgi:hypothetical protein